MSTFPGSPSVLKGGIVLVDPDSFAVVPNGIILLQYNPDTLTRSLKIKGIEEGGDRSEALRLTGPAVETIKLDAEIDATDQLETGAKRGHGNTASRRNWRPSRRSSIPTARRCRTTTAIPTGHAGDRADDDAADPVRVERARIVPVRITEFSITEEAFDPALNPMRAKVSLGCACSDRRLFFRDKGGSLYMTYQRQKETLARSGGTFGALGIKGLP